MEFRRNGLKTKANHKKGAMRFFIYSIFLITLFSSSLTYGVNTKDSSLGGNIEKERNQEPLFVSLGSACITAHMHRECGIRKAAFPFDWILSCDGEKLINILEENFLHFLNSDVLSIAVGPALLNDYYHLIFLNEGDWEDANYDIREFSKKCQRRIDRFRQLADYQGKVFFVRTAVPRGSYTPLDTWGIKETSEIGYEYADKLHQALKKYFPDLDFQLIIINKNDQSGFLIEEQSSSDILMVRIDGSGESYKDFYSQLL